MLRKELRPAGDQTDEARGHEGKLMADTEDTTAPAGSKVPRAQAECAFLHTVAKEQMVRENLRPGLEPAWLGEAKALYRRFGRLLSVLSHQDPEFIELRMASGEDVDAAEDAAEEELWAITTAILTETERQGLAKKELLLFLECVDRTAKHRPAPIEPGAPPPILPRAKIKTILVTLSVRRSLRQRLAQEPKQLAQLIERWADDKPDATRTSKYELAAALWNDIGGRTGRGEEWTRANVETLWNKRPKKIA